MAIKNFFADDPRSFRIKTSSKTVYNISPPDKTGMRDITRFPVGGSGTFIMRPIDLKKKMDEQPGGNTHFKGRIFSDVQVGEPMIIGKGEDGKQRIISDNIVEIIDTSP